MKQLTIMIKPASSLCNLRCRYCFYADTAAAREIASYGVMTAEIQRAMLANIQAALVPGDVLTLAFQGGEPTLAGLPWFERLTEITSTWNPDIAVNYAFQTNGILLDDAWCAFLADKHFLVGVSLDLPLRVHDRLRPDASGKPSSKTVLAAIERLRRFGVEFNVLSTLSAEAAADPRAVWTDVRRLDLPYVQFTPCLAPESEGSPYALTPHAFAHFYETVFPLWLTDLKRGQGRSVKLFDDITSALQMGRPASCGMGGRCQPQLVVEADGSVYPCDFYCMDEYRLGNLAEDSLENLFRASIRSPQKAALPLPAACTACPYVRFCGGGCKRMRGETTLAADGFCGYCAVLNAFLPKLSVLSCGAMNG